MGILTTSRIVMFHRRNLYIIKVNHSQQLNLYQKPFPTDHFELLIMEKIPLLVGLYYVSNFSIALIISFKSLVTNMLISAISIPVEFDCDK